jgi:hypothetical protein
LNPITTQLKRFACLLLLKPTTNYISQPNKSVQLENFLISRLQKGLQTFCLSAFTKTNNQLYKSTK